MNLGSRVFSPRPFTTAVTLLLLLLLVALGRWQLRRADEKRVLFEAFDKGTDITTPIGPRTQALPRYQHVEAVGHYDGVRQILVDNMTDADGHAGYFVITPFALTGGGWLLVNRGWIPLGPSRQQLPEVHVDGEARTLRGRADHLPSPGIHMGTPAPLRPPFPVVANFPSRADIEGLILEHDWSPAAELVLLDPDQPDGYLRRWQAPGFPPLRHIAYAVQWFGLAGALAVIYVVTNLRRSKAPGVAA
jgi:surfeit locus 1 family protein